MSIEESADTVERRAIDILKRLQRSPELTEEEKEAISVGIIAIRRENEREAV